MSVFPVLVAARSNAQSETEAGSHASAWNGNETCEEVTLESFTLSFPMDLQACETIRVGPEVAIISVQGQLILTAGAMVVLENNVFVGRTSRLVLGLDSSLLEADSEGRPEERADDERASSPDDDEP